MVAFAFGAMAASGLVYVATTWSVHARLEEAATVISNRAAERSPLDDAYATIRPFQGTLTGHARILSSGEAEPVPRDPAGQAVHRSNSAVAKTPVTRRADVPASVLSGGPEVVPEAGKMPPGS